MEVFRSEWSLIEMNFFGVALTTVELVCEYLIIVVFYMEFEAYFVFL